MYKFCILNEYDNIIVDLLLICKLKDFKISYYDYPNGTMIVVFDSYGIYFYTMTITDGIKINIYTKKGELYRESDIMNKILLTKKMILGDLND